MTYTKAIKLATPDAPAGGPEHLAAAIANAPDPTPAQRTAAAELAARVDRTDDCNVCLGTGEVCSACGDSTAICNMPVYPAKPCECTKPDPAAKQTPVNDDPQKMYESAWQSFEQWAKDSSTKTCSDQNLGREYGERMRELTKDPASLAVLKGAYAWGWRANKPYRDELEGKIKTLKTLLDKSVT